MESFPYSHNKNVLHFEAVKFDCVRVRHSRDLNVKVKMFIYILMMNEKRKFVISVYREELPDEWIPEERVCGRERWLRRNAVDHFLRAAASPHCEFDFMIRRRERIGETEIHSEHCSWKLIKFVLLIASERREKWRTLERNEMIVLSPEWARPTLKSSGGYPSARLSSLCCCGPLLSGRHSWSIYAAPGLGNHLRARSRRSEGDAFAFASDTRRYLYAFKHSYQNVMRLYLNFVSIGHYAQRLLVNITVSSHRSRIFSHRWLRSISLTVSPLLWPMAALKLRERLPFPVCFFAASPFSKLAAQKVARVGGFVVSVCNCFIYSLWIILWATRGTRTKWLRERERGARPGVRREIKRKTTAQRRNSYNFILLIPMNLILRRAEMVPKIPFACINSLKLNTVGVTKRKVVWIYFLNEFSSFKASFEMVLGGKLRKVC